MDLPLYFPTDYNRRLAGFVDPFRKKFKIVFQDFGRYGHVDVSFPQMSACLCQQSSQSSQATYTAQRQHHKQRDRSVLCASIPTLPLSHTPVKVHYPFCDQLIGSLPDLPGKVTKFTRSLASVSAHVLKPKVNVNFRKSFMTAKRTLDACTSSRDISCRDFGDLEKNLPQSVHQLSDLYSDLCQQPLLHGYNPQFSGGLLSCVPSDDGVTSLLMHARGRKLSRLAVTRVTPGNSNLVASDTVAEVRLEKVFQVHASTVQGTAYLVTRHEDSCAMFSVSDSSLRALGSIRFDSRATAPTSVCASPYVPGEALLCAQGGIVHVWDINCGLQLAVQRQPRFDCRDSWCQAYYASHPRQLVLVDRTAVQMMDHRDGFRNSVDLFALPSKLVSKQECIMGSHHHGSDSPLHAIATSHCLLLVDQRFAGTPVMQWYPDLQGPLHYLTSADYHSGGVRNGVVVVGSQHPAEVMCYPISHGSGDPVTMTMNPWRLSRMSDITSNSYASFWDSDPFLLQERLSLSLAGLAVSRGSRPRSLVFYQADSYGELYFQEYGTPHNSCTTTKTGVAFPGQTDSVVLDDVRDHVKTWSQNLQQQVDSIDKVKEPDHFQKDKTVKKCRRWLHSARHQPSEEDRVDGGGPAVEGLLCLDKVIPAVDSYETDAYTQVHLALFAGEHQALETVKRREEHRSNLLNSWKEKNRQKRNLKRHREQGEATSLHSPKEPSLAEHHTFNSLEHQQENALIKTILSEQVKPSLPGTAAVDTPDGAGGWDSSSEDTPSEADSVKDSLNLWEVPAEEGAQEKSVHWPQDDDDDDDDFFSSQDLFIHFSQSGSFS